MDMQDMNNYALYCGRVWNFSAIKEQAFFFKTNKCSWKEVKCAKYKSPRGWKNFEKWKGADRGKVRKIKFPQYIINENFEKK